MVQVRVVPPVVDFPKKKTKKIGLQTLASLQSPEYAATREWFGLPTFFYFILQSFRRLDSTLLDTHILVLTSHLCLVFGLLLRLWSQRPLNTLLTHGPLHL